jgi:hypothetical protein
MSAGRRVTGRGGPMKPPVLTVDDARDPAAEQVIAEGLRRYNREQCGISDCRTLNVVARDQETNAPLGGITGHTSLGVLFIDLFFLPEELRRGGVGTEWPLDQRSVLAENPVTRVVVRAVPGAGAAAGAA